MIPYRRRINAYIQRMVEDMQVRSFSDRTIDSYTYHVDKFCQYFGKSAEALGPEEIRQDQIYLVNEKKASWSSFNQAVCGLRFLYQVTLAKPWAIHHIPFGKRPKKLPMVLSDEGRVTFKARSKDKGAGHQIVEVNLPGPEFLRRWSLHILPKGLTKSRCYGGYHGAHRPAYLEQCRRLLMVHPRPSWSAVFERRSYARYNMVLPVHGLGRFYVPDD